MASFSMTNAPLAVTTTAAGLYAAILAALPGTVITVAVAGAALNLTFNGVVKPGYGVCILLPADQLITGTFTSSSGLHWFGGSWSCDLVLGSTLTSNDGVDIRFGCSDLGFYGSLISRNGNGIKLENCTDITVTDCLFSINRMDQFQIVTSGRVSITQNTLNGLAKQQRMCRFDDGRAPLIDVGESTCTTAGGIWFDAPHNDVVQARDGCFDVLFANNTIDLIGSQMFVTFAGAGSPIIRRARIVDNVISNAWSWAVNLYGTDLEISRNTAYSSPEASTQPAIIAYRIDTNSRVRGGLNTAPRTPSGGASGVDLFAAAINGDYRVLPPEPPRTTLPPWRPATPTPAAPNLNIPPLYISGGGISPGSAIVSGTWLTLNRGAYVAGINNATWEYRWLRNSVAISGATAQIYQAQGADVGQSITGEVRGTNTFGTGAWQTYPAVVVG